MRFKDFFQLFVEDTSFFDKIKTRSTKEIWKLSNDIRRHPEDYDESKVIDIICHNHATSNAYVAPLNAVS
jgi:hypothetical protein